MKRLKALDNMRGMIIILMIWVHLREWGLGGDYRWFVEATIPFVNRTAGPGFLFIAGISATLYIRSRLIKASNFDNYNVKVIRNEYYLRAFFIFILALIFNFLVVLFTKNLLDLWNWFMLLATSVSLMLGWPLFRLSKTHRLLLAVLVWIANYFLLTYLTLYQGQFNINGILYYILYYNVEQDPLLSYFPYFLVGTIIGEILYEIMNKDNQDERRSALKNKVLLPSLIISGVLITLSFFYGYPQTMSIMSFSWIAFTIGMNLIVLVILLVYEEYEFIKTKKSYRVLYYFSYYSLTIYLGHNLFYILFFGQLNLFSIWFYIVGVVTLLTLVFRSIYNSSWKEKLSLKTQISRLSSSIAKRIEIKKKRLN